MAVVNVAVIHQLTGEPVGEVHHPECFIVRTHSPDRAWQPTSFARTCAFCADKGGPPPVAPANQGLKALLRELGV